MLSLLEILSNTYKTHNKRSLNFPKFYFRNYLTYAEIGKVQSQVKTLIENCHSQQELKCDLIGDIVSH